MVIEFSSGYFIMRTSASYAVKSLANIPGILPESPEIMESSGESGYRKGQTSTAKEKFVMPSSSSLRVVKTTPKLAAGCEREGTSALQRRCATCVVSSVFFVLYPAKVLCHSQAGFCLRNRSSVLYVTTRRTVVHRPPHRKLISPGVQLHGDSLQPRPVSYWALCWEL